MKTDFFFKQNFVVYENCIAGRRGEYSPLRDLGLSQPRSLVHQVMSLKIHIYHRRPLGALPWGFQGRRVLVTFVGEDEVS